MKKEGTKCLCINYQGMKRFWKPGLHDNRKEMQVQARTFINEKYFELCSRRNQKHVSELEKVYRKQLFTFSHPSKRENCTIWSTVVGCVCVTPKQRSALRVCSTLTLPSPQKEEARLTSRLTQAWLGTRGSERELRVSGDPSQVPRMEDRSLHPRGLLGSTLGNSTCEGIQGKAGLGRQRS